MRKRVGLFLLALLLVCGFWSVCNQTATAAFAGGRGTVNDPYLVSTASQFNDIRNKLSSHYKLTNNINLSGYSNWTPIGKSTSNKFTGSLDGNNYAITGLKINVSNSASNMHYGLFGYCENSTIKNLTVSAPSITSAKSVYLAALVAEAKNGTIVNCRVVDGYVRDNNTTTGKCTGGMAGYLSGTAMVRNCSIEGSSLKGLTVGGLVGKINAGTLTRCYSSVSITGKGEIGGLAARCGANISECYSNGAIIQNATSTSSNYTGGLVGRLDAGSIINSFSVCDIICAYIDSNLISGFLGGGVSSLAVTNCYSGGQVSTTGNKRNGFGNVGSNCFWDIETSGAANSIAGTGKTTLQMVRSTTFTGWDFASTWTQNQGYSYPYLSGLPKPDSVEVLTELVPIDTVVTPSTLLMEKDSNQQLTVTAEMSDGVIQDVTHSSTYTAANKNIVTISQTGLITAVSPGQTSVSVGYNNITKIITVTVSPEALPLAADPITAVGINANAVGKVDFGLFSPGVTPYKYKLIKPDGSIVESGWVSAGYTFNNLIPNNGYRLNYIVRDSAGNILFNYDTDREITVYTHCTPPLFTVHRENETNRIQVGLSMNPGDTDIAVHMASNSNDSWSAWTMLKDYSAPWEGWQDDAPFIFHNLQPGHKYVYRLTARNHSGVVTASNNDPNPVTSGYTIYCYSPPVPESLVFTPGMNPWEATLDWEDTENVAGYAVYATCNGITSRIPETGYFSISNLATNQLVPNSTYTFQVCAIGFDGAVSGPSNTVSIDTPAMNPSGLIKTSVQDTLIIFALENDELVNHKQPAPLTRIEIRGSDGETLIACSDFDSSLTSRIISGLTPNTNYRVFTITQNLAGTALNPALEWEGFSTGDPAAAGVQILGPDQVFKPSNGTTSVTYSAVIEDQYGNPITDEKVVWSLNPQHNGMSIDPTSGVLTISSSADPVQASIMAVCSVGSQCKSVYILAPGCDYTYDANNRLLSIELHSGVRYEFEYDLNGNLLRCITIAP